MLGKDETSEKSRVQILTLLVEYSYAKPKPIELDEEAAAAERTRITMSREDLIAIAKGKPSE